MNEIGKKLPYKESDEYLDRLIAQATEGALQRQTATRHKRHWRMVMTSAAAVAMIVIGVGAVVWNGFQEQDKSTMPVKSPIDEFLSTLTDEEVAQLPYYEIEEIPEY